MVSVDRRQKLGDKIFSCDLYGGGILDGMELPEVEFHEVLVYDEAHAGGVVVHHCEGIYVAFFYS